MFRRLFLGGAVSIAVLALIVSQWTPPPAPRFTATRQGRNNTVLFLTSSEHGLSNVLVATAYTLLERHPEVEIHYASFPSMAPKLEQISERARQNQPSARRIVYHELPDLSMVTVVMRDGKAPASLIHPPGYLGMRRLIQGLPYMNSPWPGEDHITLVQKFTEIIDEVDPSLVVLDIFLRPAIHAARNSSRLHAYVSPLTPIEIFPLEQPYWSCIWKYPVMGSGIPFPVPWSNLLENIYINIQYYYGMFVRSRYSDVQKYLASKGLNDAVFWYNFHNEDVPVFTQALPGASIPVDVVPQSVTLTGPIILSLASAEEKKSELFEWLARAPTVLIALGSLFVWSEAHATAMAQAIADTLLARSDLQVLWKFVKLPYDMKGTTYGDDFMAPLLPFLENGRLKMVPWLDIQPVSLLETGHIVASVHHGGAGCYHEALGTGVPQLILPQWLDLYSFAQLAQNTGIGIWGCPDTSPSWTTDCLRDAFATVLWGEVSNSIQKKAKHFGEIAQSNPGQNIAAREIAKLAASGYGV
ncbi:hypothetical protein NUW58_g3464 [Xylaria curta]|uniref:Uncharacterized protein n=1 Tax=Xylaria curta TaxID=42375 RepID=A0ACC1PCF6_9PEZI|nr:hypothetical protein NUW58_g3464 [Xylaria curta]